MIGYEQAVVVLKLILEDNLPDCINILSNVSRGISWFKTEKD